MMICSKCQRFAVSDPCSRCSAVLVGDLTGNVTPKLMTPEEMGPENLKALLTAYLGDAVFAERFASCIEIIKRKNADYSQGEQKGDRIAAFRRIARDIDITMPQAWAVFAQKHWGSIMKYVKTGSVESEPIDSRIDDLINYLVLFGAIVAELEE